MLKETIHDLTLLCTQALLIFAAIGHATFLLFPINSFRSLSHMQNNPGQTELSIFAIVLFSGSALMLYSLDKQQTNL